MVCFGLCYPCSGLKVIMNGYVSGYPNGYSKAFNFCLSAELTATEHQQQQQLNLIIILLNVDLNY